MELTRTSVLYTHYVTSPNRQNTHTSIVVAHIVWKYAIVKTLPGKDCTSDIVRLYPKSQLWVRIHGVNTCMFIFSVVPRKGLWLLSWTASVQRGRHVRVRYNYLEFPIFYACLKMIQFYIVFHLVSFNCKLTTSWGYLIMCYKWLCKYFFIGHKKVFVSKTQMTLFCADT